MGRGSNTADPTEILYGEFAASRASERYNPEAWRELKVPVRKAIQDRNWTEGEWIGNDAWLSHSPRGWPAEWQEYWIGSKTGPSTASDTEIIAKITSGELGELLTCSFEIVDERDLEQAHDQPVLRIQIDEDGRDASLHMLHASSLVAVEELHAPQQGQWLYSSKLTELVYMINGQVVGSVWNGIEDELGS